MTAKAALLAGLASGVGEASGLPGWAYMLATFVIGGGVLRYYMARVEKRLKASEVRRTDANARLADAQTEEIEERLRRSLMADVDVAMQRQREETARALAAEAEAAMEVAKLVAEHARDRAEWKDERHKFINELAARDKQIMILRHDLDESRREVEVLREEVQTLRIALDLEQGRRSEDRMTALEGRATAAEAGLVLEQERNTKIEQRADQAQHVADEQAHRNDDTPGHA